MYDAWDDWHIVSSSRPVINPPEQKTNYIEIPGASGAIDLSEALTGYPVYNNRSGSFEMYVVNDYGEWQDRYDELTNFFNGSEMHIVLEDDPDWYYKGRVKVNEWQSNENWSTIVLNYTVDPYKWSIRDDVYIYNSDSGLSEELTSKELGTAPICPLLSGRGRLSLAGSGMSATVNLTSTPTRYPAFYFVGKPVTITATGEAKMQFTKGRL